MKLETDKWSIVDSLAESMGVPKETRKKWRFRGVPAAWQIKFVTARRDVLSFDDFGTSVEIPNPPGIAE
jgi:hypothetical protein